MTASRLCSYTCVAVWINLCVLLRFQLLDCSNVCVDDTYSMLWIVFPRFELLGSIIVPYTRVNKRNWLRSAYCLLSAYFFPGYAPG